MLLCYQDAHITKCYANKKKKKKKKKQIENFRKHNDGNIRCPHYIAIDCSSCSLLS